MELSQIIVFALQNNITDLDVYFKRNNINVNAKFSIQFLELKQVFNKVKDVFSDTDSINEFLLATIKANNLLYLKDFPKHYILKDFYNTYILTRNMLIPLSNIISRKNKILNILNFYDGWGSIILKYDSMIEGNLNFSINRYAFNENIVFYKDKIIIGTNQIEVWNNKKGIMEYVISEYPSFIKILCLYRENKLIVVYYDNAIKVFDIETGNLELSIQEKFLISSIDLMEDKLVIHFNHQTFLNVWDLISGDLDSTIDYQYHTPGNIKFSKVIDSNTILSILENQALITDYKTGNIIKRFGVYNEKISVINNILVVADHLYRNKILRLTDLKTNSNSYFITKHKDKISCYIFIDNILITGSDDKTINIFNIKTEKIKFKLKQQTSRISALVALPDDRFASGAEDGSIFIWNYLTGKLDKILHKHTSRISNLYLLFDLRLVSISTDDTIKVWS